MRHRHRAKSYRLKFVVLILVLAFIGGILAGFNITIKSNDLKSISMSGGQVRRMIIPAVDNTGKGITSILTVSVKDGNGLVLVNINNLVAGTDTQESARLAARTASEYTHIDTSTLDITYSIDADASSISGASAGAAMTVATIAALQDKDLNPKVSITGAIHLDGNITVVGSVPAKAEAVKEKGITTFLVPESQSYENVYTRKLDCDDSGEKIICKTAYVSEGLSLGTKLGGINVLEISNINEAVSKIII